MSTRSERMNDKALNEKHSKILKELLQQPDNKVCAECKRKDPRWASHSLGVFVCLRCSGVHRAMGTHISKMKSVDLDTWTPDQVQNMVKWGNAKANWYWEAKVTMQINDSNVDNYIRAKYERKQFARGPTVPNPDTIPVGNPAPPAQPQQQAAPAQQQQQQPKGADFFGFAQPAPTAATSTVTAIAAPPVNSVNADILSLFNAPPAAATTTTNTQSAGFANFGAFQQAAPAPAPGSQQPQTFGAFASFSTPAPQPPVASAPTSGFADFGAFQSSSSPTTSTTAATQPQMGNTFSAFQSGNFTTTSAAPVSGFANFGAFQSPTQAPTTLNTASSAGFNMMTGTGSPIMSPTMSSAPPQPQQQPQQQQPAAQHDAFAGLANWGAFK
ncbi:ARF GAP with effector function(s) [Sorochytrium milnesiophthora]